MKYSDIVRKLLVVLHNLFFLKAENVFIEIHVNYQLPHHHFGTLPLQKEYGATGRSANSVLYI